MSKKENKIKGNYGENLVCKYIEDDGYEILARNFNCSYGEIDIIASKNEEIVFIEVKTRCQNSYGEPIEAVTFTKRKHIYNSAKYFLYKSNLLDNNVRFDIIEVYLDNHTSSFLTNKVDGCDTEYCQYNLAHYKNIIQDEPSKVRRKI